MVIHARFGNHKSLHKTIGNHFYHLDNGTEEVTYTSDGTNDQQSEHHSHKKNAILYCIVTTCVLYHNTIIFHIISNNLSVFTML